MDTKKQELEEKLEKAYLDIEKYKEIVEQYKKEMDKVLAEYDHVKQETREARETIEQIKNEMEEIENTCDYIKSEYVTLETEFIRVIGMAENEPTMCIETLKGYADKIQERTIAEHEIKSQNPFRVIKGGKAD